MNFIGKKKNVKTAGRFTRSISARARLRYTLACFSSGRGEGGRGRERTRRVCTADCLRVAALLLAVLAGSFDLSRPRSTTPLTPVDCRFYFNQESRKMSLSSYTYERERENLTKEKRYSPFKGAHSNAINE